MNKTDKLVVCFKHKQMRIDNEWQYLPMIVEFRINHNMIDAKENMCPFCLEELLDVKQPMLDPDWVLKWENPNG